MKEGHHSIWNHTSRIAQIIFGAIGIFSSAYAGDTSVGYNLEMADVWLMTAEAAEWSGCY